MSKAEIEFKYKKWLVGKHIDGIEIIDVYYTSPPSGVYGTVSVKLETGDLVSLVPIGGAFRLRKKDLKYYVDEYMEG